MVNAITFTSRRIQASSGSLEVVFSHDSLEVGNPFGNLQWLFSDEALQRARVVASGIARLATNQRGLVASKQPLPVNYHGAGSAGQQILFLFFFFFGAQFVHRFAWVGAGTTNMKSRTLSHCQSAVRFGSKQLLQAAVAVAHSSFFLFGVRVVCIMMRAVPCSCSQSAFGRDAALLCLHTASVWARGRTNSSVVLLKTKSRALSLISTAKWQDGPPPRARTYVPWGLPGLAACNCLFLGPNLTT